MKNKELNKIIELIASKISGTEFANKTYVVGGYVRDLLLGNSLNDLDFVVNLPDGGIRLASFLHKKRICYRPIIYKRFGTAMVQIRGHKVEFVMTRNETYQDKSRHPEVGYGSLQVDAFRRDFTINALYYNITDKKIYDYTNLGKADLESKIIRSTSNPDIIFKEDPLRILRAIRFAGRLDFTIEKITLQGIIKWCDYLQHISVERIKDEFINMLLGTGFSKSLSLCYETGIMEYILKPLIAHEKDALMLMEKVNSYPADVTIRLALLSLVIEDYDAMENAIKNLTINKKLAKSAIQIARNVHELHDFHQIKSINKFVFDSLATIPLALKIMKISFPEFNEYKAILDKMELLAKYPYSLNGKEIIERLGLECNKEINYAVKMAQFIWVENPEMGKNELLEQLELRIKN